MLVPEIDHIIPRRVMKCDFYDRSNLRALDRECHFRITGEQNSELHKDPGNPGWNKLVQELMPVRS